MESNEEVVVLSQGEAMDQKGGSFDILFMTEANTLMIMLVKDREQ